MAASEIPHSIQATTPSLHGSHWTTERTELHAWLKRHSAPLAELYAGSVFAIFEVHFPGRFTLICHAVREIRNRLPEIVSGTTTDGRLDYASKVDNLRITWEAEHGTNLFTTGADPSRDVLPQKVGLSISLFNEIDSLIKDHASARQKPAETAARLFLAATDGTQSLDAIAPLIEQWLKVTNWFVKRSHFTGKTDAEGNWHELVKNFELFEASLSALDRQFFATVEGLDEILDKANA